MSELISFFRGAIALPQRSSGGFYSDTHAKAVSNGERDGRLYALDMARFVAMVFMMQGHVLDALVSPDIINTAVFPWNVWSLIRGFTAPIFLMVSGAVHAFATKRTDEGMVRSDVISKRIRWALTIIGIGYLLVFPAGSIWELPFVTQQGWSTVVQVNILQLTGASILFFIITMSSTRSVKHMGRRALIVAGSILVATQLMQMFPIAEQFPSWFRAYLTTSNGSIFPVFPFSAYLFVGIAVGAWLHGIQPSLRDEALKMHAWRLGLGLAAGAVFLQLVLEANGVHRDTIEQAMSVVLFLRRVGVVLVFFSLCVVVLDKTWKFRNWYSLFGTKSLYIYIIHLVLLFGTPWMMGPGRTHFRSYDLGTGFAYVAGIIATTLLLSWLFEWATKKPWALRVRTALAYTGTAVLCYLLLI